VIGTEKAWDEFISAHRWAVLTTVRDGGAPSSSVVAYARRDNVLVVSTPGTTFKARSIVRDHQVNLCVINNAEPFNFVAVQGVARLLTEDIVGDTMRIFNNIEETGYRPPADIEAWLQAEQRVIIEVTPARVYGLIR
jgi:PPOX class probable F420-dependent enzyme